MFNSTRINEIYSNSDTFPLSYEDDHADSSSTFNRSYYDDFISLHFNETNSSSIFSSSSPFTYLILIIFTYLVLTFILLTFSLYKQRQMENENFYFGDTDEDIQQGKRHFFWKQFLIGKIGKGDMKPLLIDQTDEERRTFPLKIV